MISSPSASIGIPPCAWLLPFRTTPPSANCIELILATFADPAATAAAAAATPKKTFISDPDLNAATAAA